jgi:alkylhydroperoxidase family enzyme
MSEADPSWRPTGQRIAPQEPMEWDERARAVLAPTPERVAELQNSPPSERPLHILTTLAHHGTLLEAFIGFASTLTLRGKLPRRDAEIASLRAAWNCQSEFEWGHHHAYGLAAGLEADEIAAIAEPVEDAKWLPHEAALLRAADELHQTQSLTDSTWRVLADHYDEAQCIEILFTVGQYTTLSWITNALCIPLEPHLEGLPGTQTAGRT